MATYTSNYAWTKPSGNDNVDISVLNANLDSQDSIMHDAFANMAQAFSESSTYEVGDIVVYGTTTYKCHTAVTTAGSWTGSTNWQVYKLSEGGGGTSDYPDLTNKPQINGVELSGNKSTSDLGLQDKMQYSIMPTASADNVGKIYQYVGTADANYTNGYYYKCVENSGSYSWQLVENIKEQTPTFSQASTRNNIASGDKLSVIMGKIQKFFNDLKTVAFTGSFSDLSNKPENANTFQGTIAEWNQLTTAEKKAYDHASIPDSLDGNVTFPASKVMLNNGDSVEDRLDVKTIDDTFITDSYGRFTISSLNNKKISILRAYVPDNSYIVTPYSYYNSTTQAIVTYFKVTRSDTTAYTVIASTSVAIHIDYVEF